MTITPPMRTFYNDGQLVEANDLNNDGYTAGYTGGSALTMFIGEEEAFPSVNPLTIVAGSALDILCGGANQKMLIRDGSGVLQIADNLPATDLTLSAAGSSDRIDLLVGVYFEVGVGSFTRDYEDEEGNITENGISSHYVGRSIQYTVIEGTAGSGVPAVPAGTYALASIAVAANATTLSTGDITLIPPTLSAALQNSGSVLSTAELDAAIASQVQAAISDIGTYPAISSAAITVPALGNTVTIPTEKSVGYTTNMSLEVNANGFGFVGVLTALTSDSDGYITSLTISNAGLVGSTTVGQTIQAGTVITYNFATTGTVVPPAYGVSYTSVKNFAVGAKSGTISIGPLPGDASTKYTIIVSGSLELQDGSQSIIWTGTVASGVTWPNSPQTYNNGQAATFPFSSYGTAEGGTTPTASWSTADELGFTPMTVIMAAYVNPA